MTLLKKQTEIRFLVSFLKTEAADKKSRTRGASPASGVMNRF
jgi:hypothetical protein